MNELATRTLDVDQVQLIKNTIAKGVTNDELALFIEQCNRTQLDPFARQIYAVSRYDSKLGRPVMQTQVSIDGARLVAQRSGEYAGQTPVYYCGADREWTDLWLPEDGFPKAAKVGVYRQGFAEPLWATATWDQYVQTVKDGNPNRMWKQMPALMLGKCAEMLALRKAFPMELSGLYSAEEMGQAENPPEKAEAPKTSKRKTNPTTTLRSAPEIQTDTGEAASEEILERINEGIAMLDEAEVATFKSWWKENIPMKAVDLTATHALTVERHLMELLNVDSNPQVEVETTETHIVHPDAIEPPKATQPQIGKIRAMIANSGVDKADVHTVVSDIIGRQIESLKDLTKAEAHRTIDQLTSDADE